MKKLITILLVLTIIPIAYSQKKPKNKMKFGKVSIEELQMTDCNLDSTANAVVLGDYRSYSFEHIPNIGFQISYQIYRRIKVLNNEGVDKVSDFTISLYEHNGVGEKMTSFKAYTYNLEEGNIVETKLDKKSKFVENSEYSVNHKYAFTNVKAGSILEYKYSISSDFISDFNTYYPQEDIPVLWAELHVEYFEEIKFKYFTSGSVSPFYSNHDLIQGKVIDTWIYKDVPAIEQEAYMRDVENYTAKVDYELLKIAFQGSYYQDFTTSWKEISKDIMKSDHFGKLLNKSRYFKDIVSFVKSDSTAQDEMSQVKLALEYIRNNYEWNKNNRYFPTREFSKVISKKSGNSADLNILLMGALTELGISVRPIVLSTRNHGVLLQSKPSSDDLNYTITAFYIDGKKHIVDAATDYSPIDLLPPKCLNGQGFATDINAPRWIDLEAGDPYSKRIFVQANIDEDFIVSGVYQAKEKGYAAMKIRKSIQSAGGNEKYIQDEIENSSDFSITEYSISDEENLDKDVTVKYKFSSDVQIQEMGDLISIHPILFKDYESNPFTKEVREFPVDFTYPISLDYTYIYTLPEGFVVDELPKPTRVSNEDKTMNFLLNSVARGNSITISLKFNIKKPFFSTRQYEEVKSFFDYFIDHQNQLIIIKPE